MDIKGQVAVVTGGGSGLGRSAVLALAQSGAQVIAICRSHNTCRQVAKEASGDVLPIEADVADERAVEAAFATIREVYGSVSICVNCAGVANFAKTVGKSGPASLAEFRSTIAVNLIGLFDIMRHSADLMTERTPSEDGERGVIVNVSSAAAWQGARGQAAYSASKAGVIGLMLPAARDLAEHGIRVITIAPGGFQTRMFSDLAPGAADGITKQVLYPLRLGQPEEFADLVCQIITNRYINAATISLDAGIRMS